MRYEVQRKGDYPPLKWSKNTGIVGNQKWRETDDKQ
jgi:hypothetical protein